MTTLIIAELHDGRLAGSTARVVDAARRIGGEIDLLIAGDAVGDAAEAAARLEGISRVLTADHAVYAHQLAEPVAALIDTLAADYSHLLAAASTTGKNILPRVAALRGVPQLSDIIAVEAPDRFRRTLYAGAAVATVTNTAPLKVITVRASAFEAAASRETGVGIESLATVVENPLSVFVDETPASDRGPTLGSARVVISGGRGLGSSENFQLLEGPARQLDAAIGASRAAVDAGYIANDRQVGQTGKIVAPDLYIAVGISGAIQHLAGMKDSKVIVAINSDEAAPIFNVADYGLVGDLFTVLPELTQRLSR